jgi:hypothetical protein
MKNVQLNELYWFHNIHTLTINYKSILPTLDMTYPEKINSLVRLSILVGIILSIIYYNHLFLYIPILTMLMTYILYLFREQELKDTTIINSKINQNNKNNNQNNNLNNNIPKDLVDKFEGYLDDINYTQPNIENPFMNAMPFDDRNRTPATRTIGNPLKKAEVEVSYDNGTFRDVNDIFDKNNGKRQFFTMPWTTYPNDQTSFANWLYKTPPTCKEGNGAQCVANYYSPLNKNLLTPGKGSSP